MCGSGIVLFEAWRTGVPNRYHGWPSPPWLLDTSGGHLQLGEFNPYNWCPLSELFLPTKISAWWPAVSITRLTMVPSANDYLWPAMAPMISRDWLWFFMIGCWFWKYGYNYDMFVKHGWFPNQLLVGSNNHKGDPTTNDVDLHGCCCLVGTGSMPPMVIEFQSMDFSRSTNSAHNSSAKTLPKTYIRIVWIVRFSQAVGPSQVHQFWHSEDASMRQSCPV